MPANEFPGKNPPSSSVSTRVSQLLQEGSAGALVTLIAAGDRLEYVGAKLLVEEFGGQVTGGSLGDVALDRATAEHAARFLESRVETRVIKVMDFAPELTQWSDAQILFERIQAEPRVVICGAGHVGASLAQLAGLMGYRATLIDDRVEFLTPDRFPENIELMLAQQWSEAVKLAVKDGRGVSVAIVTRGHSEDEQCLRAVMTIEADYVGLIGSKRRTNIVLQRLRESGVDEARLGKVHAPVGLDIGAVTPEEVALAIMAEIVAVRRGGKGGSLSSWRRQK